MASIESAQPTGTSEAINLPVGAESSGEVPQSSTYVSVRADMVSCWALPSSDVSLSLLSFEGRTMQVVTTVVEVDGKKGVQPTKFNGGPLLVENASIRMSAPVALEAAAGLISTAINFGLLTIEQVSDRFAKSNIKIER